MKFLSKKTRNKIITKALIVVSIVVLGTGYSILQTKPIQANAYISYFKGGYNVSHIHSSDGINYCWNETTNKCVVGNYSKMSGAVILPTRHIDGNLWNHQMVGIGDYAFAHDDNSSITSVIIPNTYEFIGDYAFEGCSGLTSINIPSSVTFIGPKAFANCTKLNTVVVQNANATIDSTAFDTLSLTSLTIGNVTYTLGSGTYATVPIGTTGYKSTISANGKTYTVGCPDTTPPVITIGSYNTDPTNQNITVTASTNEGTLNATYHTFTQNGSYTFIAKDSAGNTSSKTVTINNIDTTVITAVAKAEGSKAQADVDSAKILVNALQNSAYKTGLQSRLNVVQTYINNMVDATTKVTNAESTKIQSYVDLAQTAINVLPIGDSNRAALQSRLNIVQVYIANQAQLDNVRNAVAKAELTKLQKDVDYAQTLVATLIDGAPKTALQARLSLVQTYIDNLSYAITKVVNAESTKLQADVNAAQGAIDLLPEGDSNKDNLQSRLDAIQNYIDNLPSAANIKVTQIGKDSISISWQDGNVKKLRYQIKIGSQYVAIDGTLTTTPTWILITNKKFTIKGLTSSKSYDISVKARNQEGIICFESGTVTVITLS